MEKGFSNIIQVPSSPRESHNDDLSRICSEFFTDHHSVWINCRLSTNLSPYCIMCIIYIQCVSGIYYGQKTLNTTQPRCWKAHVSGVLQDHNGGGPMPSCAPLSISPFSCLLGLKKSSYLYSNDSLLPWSPKAIVKSQQKKGTKMKLWFIWRSSFGSEETWS